MHLCSPSPYKPLLMPLPFPSQGQGKPFFLLATNRRDRSEAAGGGSSRGKDSGRIPVWERIGEIGGMAANVGAGRSAGGIGSAAAAGSGSVAVCRPSGSRWTPTPEQIRILKELYYSCGIRSPTSEQIQRITAMLRQHGKIEGKNVFYWFQNHKARERQKRRLTNLDVNVPVAAAGGAGAADAGSTHLSVLSLSSPSGAAPPSPALGFYAGNGGAGSGVLLDTSSDWGGSAAAAVATEACFLQDYMGVMAGTGGSAGAAASPWACFSSSDTMAAAAAARTPTVTRAPETLPLFPTCNDDSQPRRPRPRHGGVPVPVPAGGGSSGSSRYLPFWGAAPTTATPSASATSVGIQHQQHQLLQMQEQYYSFYSNTTQQLPGTGSQDASAAAASLELSLSSWCSPYPAGTM